MHSMTWYVKDVDLIIIYITLFGSQCQVFENSFIQLKRKRGSIHNGQIYLLISLIVPKRNLIIRNY